MAKIDWQYTDGTVSNIMDVSAFAKGSDIYAITFTYKVDGHYYGGEFKATTGHDYTEGGSITVGYNPAKPEENDLDGRGQWTVWYHVTYCVAIAVGILFLCLRGCRH